jgi:hypothetical protein
MCAFAVLAANAPFGRLWGVPASTFASSPMQLAVSHAVPSRTALPALNLSRAHVAVTQRQECPSAKQLRPMVVPLSRSRS